jgi:hypothetical protein
MGICELCSNMTTECFKCESGGCEICHDGYGCDFGGDEWYETPDACGSDFGV